MRKRSRPVSQEPPACPPLAPCRHIGGLHPAVANRCVKEQAALDQRFVLGAASSVGSACVSLTIL
jgi:hypothetical protein